MYAQEIRPIVAEHGRLRTPADQLSEDSDLYEAGLTSLSTVNLMLALEEHFDVEFSDRMLGRKTFASIRALSDAITELRGPAQTGPGATVRSRAAGLEMTLAQKKITPAPAPVDIEALLERVHTIGAEVIAPAAIEVDREARFPHEAFAALRAEKLLSCYIPVEFGGMGLDITQVSRLCEALGHYCASTAMIFAMHQIQVACLVHHALGTPFFRDYARQVAARQLLIASATTELGIGGDVRSSICAVKTVGDHFTLEKQAPVISYGEMADAILVTARKNDEAARSDQVQVLVRQEDYSLKQLSKWDTLGFRGTCSPGFELKSMGHIDQLLPVPYAFIHSKTMHPVAHILWASLWVGLAGDALHRARQMVRQEARKNPGVTPINATRLAEADIVLNTMKSTLAATLDEYAQSLGQDDPEAFANFGFAIRVNNLKITCSTLVVDVVQRAMIICGIQGFRNDSKLTLGRHLRDAIGAGVMVNNDRILGQNATMQIGLREG